MIPMGEHKRRGRRRRRGKAAVLAAVTGALLLFSSWQTGKPPEVRREAIPAEPTAQDLVVARNLYRVNGDNGNAHIYLERWPEYAAQIMGVTDGE